MGENIFKKAKKILESKEPLINWSDPALRSEYVKELKRFRRTGSLDLLVKERRCPVCDTVKIKSRQWILFEVRKIHRRRDALALRAVLIARGEWSAMCRSCAMKYFKKELF